MTNKEQIQKLRDYAELAWASYGYFDLLDKKFKELKDKDKTRSETITLTDILNINYKGYKVVDANNEKIGTLNGEFGELQIKHFFKRYDLIEHCPNTDSGFSATLFKNKSTKEFIFAI